MAEQYDIKYIMWQTAPIETCKLPCVLIYPVVTVQSHSCILTMVISNKEHLVDNTRIVSMFDFNYNDIIMRYSDNNEITFDLVSGVTDIYKYITRSNYDNYPLLINITVSFRDNSRLAVKSNDDNVLTIAKIPKAKWEKIVTEMYEDSDEIIDMLYNIHINDFQHMTYYKTYKTIKKFIKMFPGSSPNMAIDELYNICDESCIVINGLINVYKKLYLVDDKLTKDNFDLLYDVINTITQ